MAAGITLLRELNANSTHYAELRDKTVYLKNGLDEVLRNSGKDFVINQFESMLSLHFSKQSVTDFASASASDTGLFKKFFHAMLKRGIYLPPSAFESWFLNNALSYDDLDRTIHAAAESIREI